MADTLRGAWSAMKRDLIRPGHSLLLLWKMILALASFRFPMPVTEPEEFPDCCDRPNYYVCPRCGLTNAKIVYLQSHSQPDL